MKYVSTRGGAPVLEFDEVLLAGLARDGGLYLPEAWPQFSAAEIRALAGLGYAEIAVRIMRPFVGPAIPEARLRAIAEEPPERLRVFLELGKKIFAANLESMIHPSVEPVVVTEWEIPFENDAVKAAQNGYNRAVEFFEKTFSKLHGLLRLMLD